MIDQTEIHRKSKSSEIVERREAVNQLRYNFTVLPDKNQAWDDLIRLTKDRDTEVRVSAYHSLGRACIFKATETERCDLNPTGNTVNVLRNS